MSSAPVAPNTIEIKLTEIERKKWEAFAPNVEGSPIVRAKTAHKAIRKFSKRMKRARNVAWVPVREVSITELGREKGDKKKNADRVSNS
jgi:hypothetical protein